MAEIRWTSEAADRLEQIYVYIAENDINAAYSVVCGIYNKIQILKEYPKIGHLHKNEKEGEIRILLYGNYKIGYLIHDMGTIEILGISHGSMPIDRWLKINK